MATRRAARERLLLLSSRVPRIRVRSRWWRITRPGTSALYYSADAFDGRWQSGAVVRGLYLADCEDTAWAEWMRAAAEQGVPPDSRLPRSMCPLDVDLDDIVDLTRPKSLTRLGLGPMRPTQAQWAETQPVGERLWRDGAVGILSPSAAHKGHRVLAVFRTGPEMPGVVEAEPVTVHDAIPRIPTGLRT